MRRFINFLRASFWVCIALVIIAIPALYFTSQSKWFRSAIHNRAIAEIEKATGGKAELGAITFDWQSQVATVKSFVLHGTEPAGVAPLFTAESIEIGLRADTTARHKQLVESSPMNPRKVRL